MGFDLVEVASIGTRAGNAFVDREDATGRRTGAIETVTTPVYPPSPPGRTLRKHRVGDPGDGYLALHEAARALGMSAADVSGLETGRLTFADRADWPRAMEAITAARAEKQKRAGGV